MSDIAETGIVHDREPRNWRSIMLMYVEEGGRLDRADL